MIWLFGFFLYGKEDRFIGRLEDMILESIV